MTGPPAPRTAIFFQDACYRHRFLRSSDLSTIVERPERLRALKIGFAAAIARMEQGTSGDVMRLPEEALHGQDESEVELAAALQKLDLEQDSRVTIVDIIHSKDFVDLLNNKAVKFVHGDVDGDVYLENLIKWAKESTEMVKQGGSEIPEYLPQGDLYLCPESLDAIQGALGTICQAVDEIVDASHRSHEAGTSIPTAPLNAFVAIRPPGHHCGEDTPSGFCFVNNVIVAATHAHLNHGINKIVILDIDLHHGNGTQALAWQINEDTYRQTLEGGTSARSGLQIFYGSLHDVLSFPCEDGNVTMVQAASVSIHGLHGQHIENVHLQQYESHEDFWQNLYPNQYSRLLKKAEEFVNNGGGTEVLVFISCGFDACEHEYPSMSRHNRRVPASFYRRFAVDARNFANKFAEGKLISVLEGGYSDRALISGGMAHLSGLVDTQQLGIEVDEEWWNINNLTLLEKLAKKRRGNKASLGGCGEKWLERTLAIFQSIETVMTPSTSKVQIPPSSRTLRGKKPASTVVSPKESPRAPCRTKPRSPPVKEDNVRVSSPSEESVEGVQKHLESLNLDKTKSEEEEVATNGVKKVPRVILRIKEPEKP